MSVRTSALTPPIASRLPNVGTTIFSVMSALATETGAVNLGQGFPDFECDPALVDAVTAAMRSGHNQYPPMPGVPALRQAMADKMLALYGLACDPATDITVTAGATQAILTAILAIVQPGDEVIVLEPCYDSYVPNIELAGGVVVRVPLTPGNFRPDFSAIAAAITPRTRAIIINSPHNPSGQVWSQADMLALQDLLAPTSILLISDEVYEHMVFDGEQHQSAARYPGSGGARVHRQQLWQDLPRDRLENRHGGGSGAPDGRVSQGAPVQRVHSEHTHAARPGDLHGQPGPLPGARRTFTNASATCSVRV